MRIKSAEYVRSAHDVADLPRDGLPQVAFVGRSNVGKSSLLNRLLGHRSSGKRALARVSATPGRTRAVNLFLVDRKLYFVDLPGYGYAKASKDERRRWAELTTMYFETVDSDTTVIQLVDAKVGATELDCDAHEYLAGFCSEILVAATKIDRVRRSQRQQALAAVAERLPHGTKPLPVSARTGEGIPELLRAIAQRVGTRA